MDEKVCLLYIIIYIKEYDKFVDILYRKRCLYVVLGIKISGKSFCVKTTRIIYASYPV